MYIFICIYTCGNVPLIDDMNKQLLNQDKILFEQQPEKAFVSETRPFQLCCMAQFRSRFNGFCSFRDEAPLPPKYLK